MTAFDILVIGGGNAGVSAAARLQRAGITDVAIIEPQQTHTYRPLLSYVGAGQASPTTAQRSQQSVTPRGCTWLQDSVVTVDATTRTVTCASGQSHRYRDLVVGPGLVPDHSALPGIDSALSTPSVASNYLDRATKTWELVRSMPAGGRAVFTVPRAPVSCTGTTLKPLFLAAAHWKRDGRLPGIDIALVIDRPRILDVPRLDDRLYAELRNLGVRILQHCAVTELTPGESQITVTDHAGRTEHVSYDFLHLVPPYRGPQWLETSGLVGDAAHGLVDIDPKTFQHRQFPDIWAVGDGAAVQTDPSGGGLRRQVSIMVGNVLAHRSGEALSDYDGYTVAPIAIGSHSLILGEFDRGGELASSLPSLLDPLKPRRIAWAFDRFGLPVGYWHGILKGRL